MMIINQLLLYYYIYIYIYIICEYLRCTWIAQKGIPWSCRLARWISISSRRKSRHGFNQCSTDVNGQLVELVELVD